MWEGLPRVGRGTAVGGGLLGDPDLTEDSRCGSRGRRSHKEGPTLRGVVTVELDEWFWVEQYRGDPVGTEGPRT